MRGFFLFFLTHRQIGHIGFFFLIVRIDPSVSPQLCDMIDFTALHDCSEPNFVGLPIIEFLPTSDVLEYKTFELLDGRLRGSIILKAGKKWLKMPIRPVDASTQFWEETKAATVQGVATDLKIQGLLPMQSPQIQAQLDDMERQKFIVRTQDVNGRTFVFGSIKFPLNFSSVWSSTRGFYTIEWKSKQPQKAIGY